ncbi:MAG: ATP-binding protein [Bacteroidota bacterium]
MVQALVSENDPTQFCYNSIVVDDSGRLWLKPCSVAEQLYGLNVVQFDGYDRWPITVRPKSWQGTIQSNLEGFSSKGFLYGFINQNYEKSTLYNFDISRSQLKHTSIVEGIIGGIEEYESGKFWVLQKVKGAFNILHWDGLQIDLYATIPNKSHTNSLDHPFANQAKSNFIYQDSALWIIDKYLPLISFHIPAKSIKKYNVASFPGFNKGLASDLSVANSESFVTIRDSIVYFMHDVLSPQFYQLDLRKATNQFSPISFVSPQKKAEGIWQDELGNLLFIYENTDKTTGAILLDNNKQLFDYTAIIANLPTIEFVHGRDFKQQALFGTRRGAYFVQLFQPNSISTIPTPRGPRHIRQLDSDEFIVWIDQDPKIIKDGQITNRFEQSCFQAALEVPGRKGLLTDSQGQVWLQDRLQLRRYMPDSDGSCIRYPFGMEVDRAQFLPNDKLIIQELKNKELFQFDLNTKEVSPISSKPLQFKSIIHDMQASSNEILWLATNEGLYKVNLINGEVKHYGYTPDFEDHRILVIHEDRRGHLWLGTVSRGIQVFDPQKEEVYQVINETDGLSNNIVVGILEDEDGDIWAATYNGLSLVSPKGKVITILKKKDGLLHNEFNRYAHFKSQDGMLFFGGVNGINILNPQLVKQQLKSSQSTNIYTTQLTYYDAKKEQTTYLRNYVPHTTPLNLTAEQRFLTVNVGMSNYGNSATNRFAYRLAGLQDDWNYMESEHIIRLPNLPSGNYQLEIAGIDHNGNWTSNTIQIPIRAKEFFYRQSWFYVLCAMPFLIFAFLWIRRLRYEKYRLKQEVYKRTLKIRQDKELIQQQANELQQLDQMKSRFFANISHDLRTPITLISGPAELLAEEEYIQAKGAFHKAVLTISKNSKRLLGLIDEILDLARLESKTVKLHEEIISVMAFTQSIFDTYSLEAQRKKVQLDLIVEVEDAMKLLVDPNRLEKILNNLLSNALKFTTPGDNIQLRISKDQEQIIFEVADTGRGIPAEDLPHVFERFFQSKNPHLVQTSGSGIGLSLCQDFAKLMKGSLTVNSTFGQGSTFRLNLPVKDYANASPSRHAKTPKRSNTQTLKLPNSLPPKRSNSSTFRVMIVEDNLEVQGFLQQLLAPHYEIITFDDGQEALDFLVSQKGKPLPVDLILSDINMPRLDGYGLIDAIKKEEPWRQLPMIMLTARLQEHSKLQALRMGVDDYLTKPFSPTELKVRIANILGNYQKRLAYQQEYLKIDPAFETTRSADQVWLEELEKYTLAALSQQIDLTASYLAQQMHISERKIARKTKLLTGLTIGRYIQEVKLQKARHLLEQRTFETIAEVGFACGFKSRSYFTKVFTEYFGKSPSNYLERNQDS